MGLNPGYTLKYFLLLLDIQILNGLYLTLTTTTVQQNALWKIGRRMQNINQSHFLSYNSGVA